MDSGQLIAPPYNTQHVDAGHGRKIPIGFIHTTVQGYEDVGAYGTFNCSYQPIRHALHRVPRIHPGLVSRRRR